MPAVTFRFSICYGRPGPPENEALGDAGGSLSEGSASGPLRARKSSLPKPSQACSRKSTNDVMAPVSFDLFHTAPAQISKHVHE